MKIARVVKVEPMDPSDAFHLERRSGGAIERSAEYRAIRQVRRLWVALLVITLSGVGYIVYSSVHATRSTITFETQAVKGKVGLTGEELRQLVVQEAITAYWVGPEPGARYALSVLNDGQVFVRYLANGKGLEDKKAAYKVIATYVTANAFAKTQEAATSKGGVGFINADGDAVYYATARPTNVYIGLKNQNFQVEVYDPVAGGALTASKSSGVVRKVV